MSCSYFEKVILVFVCLFDDSTVAVFVSITIPAAVQQLDCNSLVLSDVIVILSD